MKKDLLEDVTQQIESCEYISDLKLLVHQQEINQLGNAVRSLNIHEYPVEQ